MPPMVAATNQIRKNILLSGKLSQELVISPAILPPSDRVRNHPPLINAVSLAGASFETSDKPIGLRKISAIVIMK